MLSSLRIKQCLWINAIYPLLQCQSSSSSLVRASDQHPGSTCAWILMSSFHQYIMCEYRSSLANRLRASRCTMTEDSLMYSMKRKKEWCEQNPPAFLITSRHLMVIRTENERIFLMPAHTVSLPRFCLCSGKCL